MPVGKERGAGVRRLGKELVRGGEGAMQLSGSHQLMVVRGYARCSSSSVSGLRGDCSAKERDADEAQRVGSTMTEQCCSWAGGKLGSGQLGNLQWVGACWLLCSV